jgi:hypothetical protein
MHERLLRLTSSLLRQLQRPFARDGQVRPPRRLNPAGDRPLPALARKSFRQLWKEGELGDG